MRTTIQIPDELFEELMAITNPASQTAAIRTAVEHFVRRNKLERLRALRGQLDITGTEDSDLADIT